MSICKFTDCQKQFVAVGTRRRVTDKLLRVYCYDCVQSRFEPNGMPKIINNYGGLRGIWKSLKEFIPKFTSIHNLKEIGDIEKFYEPRYVWNTRVHRKDKKDLLDTFGTADLSEWVLTLYVRRSKSVNKLMDTFIHELVHFVTFFIYNDYQDGSLQGHTKLFWKFFFEFCEYINFDYALTE